MYLGDDGVKKLVIICDPYYKAYSVDTDISVKGQYLIYQSGPSVDSIF